MSLLSIDAGTSAIKAAIITDDGRVLAVAREQVASPPSAGVDPSAYWEHLANAIRSVSAEGDAIEAIAVTGQGQGLWTLADDGQPAGPAYQWNSVVAGDVIARWEADGTIERHYRSTGTVLWPGTNAALWTWLKSADPDHAERINQVFCAKDWINYKLSGVVATDITDATIPFLDLESGKYSDEVLASLECSDLEAKLAPILANGSTIGSLLPETASSLGLGAGIPILMGCIDGVALASGAGLRNTGDSLVVMGTTAAAISLTDDAARGGDPVGATLRLPGEGQYLRFLGANSGTSTLDWYRKVAGCTFDEFWADVAAGQPGVTMLPYLAGERVPFLAPDATGTFIGLTPRTGRPELARAVAHGITYSLRHCVDAAGRSAGPIVLTGGGAASQQWNQLVADVTQRTVLVDERPHIACVGLMHLVSGRAAAPVEDRPTYRPQLDYSQEYRAFVQLGQRLRPIWSELAGPNDTQDHAPMESHESY